MFNDLPNTNNNNSVFYYNGSIWQTWYKPDNVKFIYIFMLGGGGGGAGGQSTAGTARTGGGGGATSAITRGMFAANTLPDILYIQVGSGGTGGAPASFGATGSLSYIGVQPNSTTASNIILASGSGGAGGGLASGTGGSAGSAFTQANGLLSYLGNISSTIGLGGSAGGANTGAVGTSTGINQMVLPGAGGGGSSATPVNGAGGNITGAGIIPTLSGGVAGGANKGADGYMSMSPSINSTSSKMFFMLTGGAGGGANGAGIGGDGGLGMYGCGGGGGAGATGGSGGAGGPGIVMITTW